MVVRIELGMPNDCTMPEPGVCSESAGIGRASASATAMFSKSRLVLALDYYSCERLCNCMYKYKNKLVGSLWGVWK